MTVFQLLSVLRKNYVTKSIGGRMNVNQKKEQQAEYGITQIWNFPIGLGYKVQIVMFTPYYPHAQQLSIYEDMIEWATGSREVGRT